MAKGGRSGKSSSGGLGNMFKNDNSNFLGSLLGSLTFGFIDVHKCEAEEK